MMMSMSMLIISLTLCHSVWEIWNVDIKFIIRQRRNNNTATTTSQSVSHSVGELSFTEWLMVRNLGGKRGGWFIGLIAWRPIPITRFDVDMTSRLMLYFPGVWCFVSYHPSIHPSSNVGPTKVCPESTHFEIRNSKYHLDVLQQQRQPRLVWPKRRLDRRQLTKHFWPNDACRCFGWVVAAVGLRWSVRQVLLENNLIKYSFKT